MRNFDNLVNITRSLKKTNQTGQSFHVAFAMKGGSIIDIGINSYNKANAVSATYAPTKNNAAVYVAGIHAEQALMGRLKYRNDISDMTIIVIRIDNNGKIANSIPCPNCAHHLGLAGFRKVYFSTGDGTFAKF